MKFLPQSGMKLHRAIIVSVIVLGNSFALQLLHAQTAAPATNSTSTQGTTNSTAASSPSTPPSTNSAPIQGITNAPTLTLAPQNQTNSSTEQDLGSPGAIAQPQADQSLNAPAIQDITNQPGETSETLPGGIPNSPAVQNVTGQPNALLGGASPLHFGLTAGEMYDDNILIAPDSEKQGSFITHVSPSIDYQRGDQTAPHMNYLNLYFSPGYYIYHNVDDVNRVDYDGDIYYQYTFTRLILGLELHYQHLTDANLDEGSLVSRNIYTTKMNAHYFYNDKLTLYGTATQQINNYPGITINEWDLDSYALYQVAPKVLVGAGPRIAFLDITGAPNEAHQDLLGRLRYAPDAKITLSFDGGVEYLQFQGHDDPSRILPIFDCSCYYSPFDGTGLYLAAYRASLNSYDLQGDQITNTSIQAGFSQQFLQNFNITGSIGYALSDYQSTSASEVQGEAGQRTDDYYFAKGGVEWTPNAWLKAQVTYQWSNNDSSFAQNTFSDNQVDIQSSVHF